MRQYNRIDLENTYAVLEVSEPNLRALAALSVRYGQDLRSVPTPQVVERIFVSRYRESHNNCYPPDPSWRSETIYRPPAGVLRPRSPGAAQWHDEIVNVLIKIGRTKGSPDIHIPEADFPGRRPPRSPRVRAGCIPRTASTSYMPDDEWELWSTDAASYVPDV